jgi:hypothetical protein
MDAAIERVAAALTSLALQLHSGNFSEPCA